MPYATNRDLPAAVRRRLPASGQSMWREVFNSAARQYPRDERRQFAIAWGTVKRHGFDPPADLTGGLSEGMSPADFDAEQLEIGTKIELEHTKDRAVAQRIAMDHLKEFGNDYYKALVEMERQLQRHPEPSGPFPRQQRIDELRTAIEKNRPKWDRQVETPGAFVTGRSNRPKSLVRRLDVENRRMEAAFRAHQEMQAELDRLESIKSGWLAGRVHPSGQPVSRTPAKSPTGPQSPDHGTQIARGLIDGKHTLSDGAVITIETGWDETKKDLWGRAVITTPDGRRIEGPDIGTIQGGPLTKAAQALAKEYLRAAAARPTPSDAEGSLAQIEHLQRLSYNDLKAKVAAELGGHISERGEYSPWPEQGKETAPGSSSDEALLAAYAKASGQVARLIAKSSSDSPALAERLRIAQADRDALAQELEKREAARLSVQSDAEISRLEQASNDEINNAYWRFSRTAGGVPPVLAAEAAHRTRRLARAELKRRKTSLMGVSMKPDSIRMAEVAVKRPPLYPELIARTEARSKMAAPEDMIVVSYTKRNGITLRGPTKPHKAHIAKARSGSWGFRWSPKQKLWYVPRTRDAVIERKSIEALAAALAEAGVPTRVEYEGESGPVVPASLGIDASSPLLALGLDEARALLATLGDPEQATVRAYVRSLPVFVGEPEYMPPPPVPTYAHYDADRYVKAAQWMERRRATGREAEQLLEALRSRPNVIEQLREAAEDKRVMDDVEAMVSDARELYISTKPYPKGARRPVWDQLSSRAKSFWVSQLDTKGAMVVPRWATETADEAQAADEAFQRSRQASYEPLPAQGRLTPTQKKAAQAEARRERDRLRREAEVTKKAETEEKRRLTREANKLAREKLEEERRAKRAQARATRANPPPSDRMLKLAECALKKAAGDVHVLKHAWQKAEALVQELGARPAGCGRNQETAAKKQERARVALTRASERYEQAKARELAAESKLLDLRRGAGLLDDVAARKMTLGASTVVVVPSARGTPRSIPARFALVDAESVIPSHDATTFQPRSDYPAGVQERKYERDQAEQLKVQDVARNMIPGLAQNTNAGAIDGTPIIDGGWIALSGNGRAMGIQRHYRANQTALREWLKDNAAQFGLERADVQRQERPMMVRLISVEPSERQRLVRDFNEGLTQKLDVFDEFAAKARQLPTGLPAILRDGLADQMGVKAYLASQGASPLIFALEQSGYINRVNRSRLLSSADRLGREAQAEVAQLLSSAVLPGIVAPQLRALVDRSAAAWLVAAAAGDAWDIRPALGLAVTELGSMKAAEQCLARWRQQADIEGARPSSGNELATLMLELLIVTAAKPRVFEAVAKSFAAKSRAAGGGLFGAGESPIEALRAAATENGVELSDSEAKRRCRK